MCVRVSSVVDGDNRSQAKYTQVDRCGGVETGKKEQQQ